MRDMEGIYRAKRRDGGGWIEGYFYIGENDTPLISSLSADGDPLEPEIDPSTLCRYTDKTDRHGTPIFENDIVRISGIGERLVQWSMGKLAWMYSEKPYDHYEGYLSEIPSWKMTFAGNLFSQTEKPDDSDESGA